MLRKLRYAALALAIPVLACAAPIVHNEVSCVQSSAAQQSYLPIIDTPHRRDEVNSYLTYPEWSIVHAYEDFAAVTRAGSESDFAYLRSISNYWSSLCGISQFASTKGAISVEYKVMLYTIGVSFAAEMGLKGIYESTVGRFTAWLRGPNRTPEDAFALAVADEYAAFLRQTPWYEFPFATKVSQFWAKTPFLWDSPLRSMERRVSLSIEYGAKAVYAWVIGLGAAAAPAPLSIYSAVRDLGPLDLSSDQRIVLVSALDDGTSIIETPRYRAFTDILRYLATSGRNLVEIAGNDDVLVTVVARGELPTNSFGATQLFAVPVQSKPGWRRLGLDVKVVNLLSIIRQIQGSSIELEHVYDY